MIPEKALPSRNSLLNLLSSQSNLPLLSNLPLSRRNLFILDILHWQKHLFHPDQVGGEIFLEATRHEGARCISPGEEPVAPAWSVHGWVGGDVEDGPVDGEVDGEGSVGPVVEG